LSRCLGSEARYEVGIGELLGDALQEELDRRGVGNVQVLRIATTSCDEAADTSAAVDDDGARVALTREGVGLKVLVVGKNRPLLGSLGFLVSEVVTDKGEDVVATTDGQAGGISPLEYHETRLAVLVDHARSTQLSGRDSTLKR